MMKDDKEAEQATAGQESKAEGGSMVQTTDGGRSLSVGGMEVYNASQIPFVGQFFAAIVLLVALTSDNNVLKSHKYHAYGIAIAVVTMFFSLACWVMSRFKITTEQNIKMVNYFLVLWNFIGACFMTFGGPFKDTGNGYFSSWGLVIFAVMGIGLSGDEVKDYTKNLSMNQMSLVGMSVASVIVIVAISFDGINGSRYKTEQIYGLIVACMTVIVVIGLTKTEAGSSPLAFPVIAIFALLWIVAACLLTFRGPFWKTGNGYFASWGGAVTSIFAVATAPKPGQQQQSGEQGNAEDDI